MVASGKFSAAGRAAGENLPSASVMMRGTDSHSTSASAAKEESTSKGESRLRGEAAREVGVEANLWPAAPGTKGDASWFSLKLDCTGGREEANL